jgi:hypothetical protein
MISFQIHLCKLFTCRYTRNYFNSINQNTTKIINSLKEANAYKNPHQVDVRRLSPFF